MRINKSGIFMGFDPGTTHLGISVILESGLNRSILLYQVEMERISDSVERISNIFNLFINQIKQSLFTTNDLAYLCIEGAAFGDKYRQVELAEIRGSIIPWCYEYGITVKIVPPKTIRKAVFGNGNIKAQDVWTTITPDAANALACAYYSAMGL